MTETLLQDFATIAEQVAATTKKLEKARLLGAYFQTLSDADLTRAARYFAGHTFAMNDGRTTNVGTSVLRNALSEVTKLDIDNLRPRYVRLGDAGDVTFEALMETGRGNDNPTVTLAHTEQLITRLSETRGTKNKLAILIEILARMTPLEAKYLVKMLVGDLRIGLKEGLVEDAIARAFERLLPEVANVNMLTGDIGETAVRARHNDFHNVKMRLFHPIKFMLATAAADLDDVRRTMPAEFYTEDKFDGIRGQAHVQRGRVALFSRSLDDITHRFPELIEPLARLETDAILDGEILPATKEKILPFADLQKRLGRKIVSEELMKQTPVVFVAYDVLYADGIIRNEASLSARRELLAQLITEANTTDTADADDNKNTGALRLSDTRLIADAGLLDKEFDDARTRGNEGLMIKDPRSTYKPGKRGREWLKIKRTRATLDVVVTAAEVGHGRRRIFLSDYTFAVRRSEDDAELLNVGKAYSGLTDVEVAELTEWFKANTIQEFAHGRVRTVTPKIIFEVTFDKVQKSPRHKSGYALRFPRILRWRQDKTVDEIDTLEAVCGLVDETGDEADGDVN
ncbi:MAG: ATP-dependent DNA ligase [Pyrinomonadaceae bacterium MAG19_C2-C3]|nr:ATP-dependent DNA ligase [Pyrinomonadaceae bacterium MAG19_C2-C3]